MPRMKLFPAAAPELVRCKQKDRFYSDQLTSSLSELSRKALPLRLWLRWQREMQLLAELAYHGLTTVLGNQTLGEEYCNVVQVGPAVNRRLTAAGFTRRLLPVLVQSLGVYLLEKALEELYRKIRDRNLGSLRLSEQGYELLEKIVGTTEEVLTGASRLHLALFYLHGVFYHIGKRIASVKYFMIRYDTPQTLENSATSTYRVLGWLILIQLAIQAAKLVYGLFGKREEGAGEGGINTGGKEVSVSRELGRTELSQLKCSLCLEQCCDQTSTVCGHIFCWVCICEWTSEKPECPVCRTTVQPQQLVCLQHFNS